MKHFYKQDWIGIQSKTASRGDFWIAINAQNHSNQFSTSSNCIWNWIKSILIWTRLRKILWMILIKLCFYAPCIFNLQKCFDLIHFCIYFLQKGLNSITLDNIFLHIWLNLIQICFDFLQMRPHVIGQLLRARDWSAVAIFICYFDKNPRTTTTTTKWY